MIELAPAELQPAQQEPLAVRLLTPDEVATILRIRPRTLDYLLQDGLPHFLVAGQVRIFEDELYDWLLDNRAK